MSSSNAFLVPRWSTEMSLEAEQALSHILGLLAFRLKRQTCLFFINTPVGAIQFQQQKMDKGVRNSLPV